MPVNPNLDVNYTAAQITTIETALNAAITDIKTAIGPPLNLSDDERGDTPSVDVQREPYVRDAVENLGTMFPNMVGQDITQARALNLWKFRIRTGTFSLWLTSFMIF
jgi:hypothetical protein